ncbi:MAG: ATP-binding protein [Burkholderiaceae bacterium]
MTGSLRLRLLVSLAAILVCGTLIQALVAYRGARAAADAQFDYQMEQIALSIAYGMPASPDPRSPRLAADIRNFDFIVQVWSVTGVRVFASEPRILIAPDTPSGLSDWRGDDGRYRMVTIREPGRVIQVAQDQAIRTAAAGDFAWQAVAPIAIWAPVLLVVGLLLLNRALRPLARVREQVAARRAADLSPIDGSALPDEIGPVIDEFNGLLERLRLAFDAQGRFVADAAHELRTPLAALKLQVQSLARQATQPGIEPAIGAAVGRLSGGIARAARLVDQLLVLAREDHRSQRRAPIADDAVVDLAAAARESVAALSDLAAERRLDLGFAGNESGPAADAEPAQVAGDADSIGILIRNLVDNAIKYTPPGGRIDVRVTTTGEAGSSELVVEDSGPGVPAHQRERLFDRFHRLATADTVELPIGSGLGLAIVRAIADRHWATITIDDSPELGGLRVTVRFPPPVQDDPASAALKHSRALR